MKPNVKNTPAHEELHFTFCRICDDLAECEIVKVGTIWLHLRCDNGHEFKEAK